VNGFGEWLALMAGGRPPWTMTLDWTDVCARKVVNVKYRHLANDYSLLYQTLVPV